MKKLFFIIPLILIFSSFFLIDSKAATANDIGYFIYKRSDQTEYGYQVIVYNFDHFRESNSRDNKFYYGYTVRSGAYSTYERCLEQCNYYLNNTNPSNYIVNDTSGFGDSDFYNNAEVWVYNIPYRSLGSATINNLDEPPEPEPGSSWLSDIWEWFLWQLGINDDYSGDIDAYITGGDRERMEYVTPTPSPTPTPYPSPTPFDLTINYPDGSTGTITGIPGSTTIINGGDTTNNYGSDFDIFAVDVQIGDGGTSNPKDGLNSVMEASNDYLKDIDISPVQNSFSIIPSNWFLFIGVLAALPFIAGFIMRLLK